MSENLARPSHTQQQYRCTVDCGVKHRAVKLVTVRAQVRSHMTTSLSPEERRCERTERQKSGISDA
eukprot:3345243-Pyramimonas_sp.AAC.1